MKPGMTVLPPASIVRPPLTFGAPAPTDAMRPSVTTTCPCSITVPLPSSTRAFVMTRSCASAAAAQSQAVTANDRQVLVVLVIVVPSVGARSVTRVRRGVPMHGRARRGSGSAGTRRARFRLRPAVYGLSATMSSLAGRADDASPFPSYTGTSRVSSHPVAKLSVKVVPRASRDEIVGWLGDKLKIKIAAPPQDGRANDALEAFLAKALGLPRRAVRIAAGHGSTSKV